MCSFIGQIQTAKIEADVVNQERHISLKHCAYYRNNRQRETQKHGQTVKKHIEKVDRNKRKNKQQGKNKMGMLERKRGESRAY